MNKSLKELFEGSENYSFKWEKYFDVYEKYFQKYKNSKITFVEIGIFNGGSLPIWKNYFGPDSRIIGIDINPQCKKFENNGVEVFIGNQSDPVFWDEFFKKVGNVDIILDDGGHTNLDQIMTTVKCIDKINDNGLLVIEDTHTSYLNHYNSNKKFSFINFAKKIIDDVNYKFPFKENIKKKFSLNDYIYSVHFYESIVIFEIDRQKTNANKVLENDGVFHNINDLSTGGNEINIKKFKNLIKNIPIIRMNKLTKKIANLANNEKIKKFFD